MLYRDLRQHNMMFPGTIAYTLTPRASGVKEKVVTTVPADNPGCPLPSGTVLTLNEVVNLCTVLFTKRFQVGNNPHRRCAWVFNHTWYVKGNTGADI